MVSITFCVGTFEPIKKNKLTAQWDQIMKK